jgi:hypothetical protein
MHRERHSTWAVLYIKDPVTRHQDSIMEIFTHTVTESVIRMRIGIQHLDMSTHTSVHPRTARSTTIKIVTL